jgi:hypothetical protein
MNLQKKAVEVGVLPSNAKWRKTVQAYGELYIEGYRWAKKEGTLDEFANVIYERGRKNGKRFKEKFGLSETAGDAAFALIAGHRLFGIKSKIVENTQNKSIIHVSDCPWKEVFTPEACDILGNIERGTCGAISQDLSYSITKKITNKDGVCEFVIAGGGGD